jgi:hypothetical protein
VIYGFLLVMVYTVFVLRYWLLSRKIRSVLNEIEDLYSNLSVRIIFSIQTIWMAVISILYLVYSLNAVKINSYFFFLYCMPNIFVVLLLIDAIIVLKRVKSTKYTISIKKLLFLAVVISAECISSILVVMLG